MESFQFWQRFKSGRLAIPTKRHGLPVLQFSASPQQRVPQYSSCPPSADPPNGWWHSQAAQVLCRRVHLQQAAWVSNLCEDQPQLLNLNGRFPGVDRTFACLTSYEVLFLSLLKTHDNWTQWSHQQAQARQVTRPWPHTMPIPFYCFYKWNHDQYNLAFLNKNLQKKSFFHVEVKTDFYKLSIN